LKYDDGKIGDFKYERKLFFQIAGRESQQQKKMENEGGKIDDKIY